ncbi:MAG TPA: permease-like cell division protein FtsX [Bacillota bacterium]|mgnify:CR=1 FL=1|nr:permease-like cell division protein FtsX [Bacillota bacterium]HPE37903.1 permease-like cell division protein FtsX [Bacillota bacterium]
MTIRAFGNSVKEGFQGIIRHPLVTIASVTTILLMLLLMSVFFVFSADARYIMKKVGQQPPIEIYMKLNCSNDELNMVSQYLSTDTEHVKSFAMLNPEQNYNRFKSNLGSSASILDDFDYNTYLPYTFTVQLQDPSYAGQVVTNIQAVPGVNKVMTESRVMLFLTETTKVVNIGTAVAFAVLFLISLFIISNMVRISVYSRATEISIMKFVGATNGYIRLPYIVEGGIVGCMSAIFAFLITYFSYARIYDWMMAKIEVSSYYALLPANRLAIWVLVLCLVSGIVIGAIGSGIAVRKYIKV